jgi:GNAT superfamily N-acetyltransferase
MAAVIAGLFHTGWRKADRAGARSAHGSVFEAERRDEIMTTNTQVGTESVALKNGGKSVELRTYKTDDFPGIVNLQNVTYPDMPGSVEEYLEGEKKRDPKIKHQRWVAVAEGQIVGAGVYDQRIWSYHPQKFWLAGGVLPAWQDQGLGKILYDKVMEGLELFDPIELNVNVRSDKPQGLRFFEKRGFSEHMREGESHLDVMAFDPAPYDELEEKLCQEGIDIKTFSELKSDTERDRKVYDLEWELLQDVPGSEELTQVPYDKWLEDVIESQMFLPDAYFLALDGSEFIGMSNLWDDRASDALYTGLTGVKRSHRCRGIATALKVRAIAYARATGHPVIKTGNEVNNRPMLSINERLGFVRQPDWISLRKVLREA